MEELKEKYSEFNDYELINIVYFESSEYREEAIKVAKSVLEERGLSQPTDEILQRAKEYRKAPASDFDEDLLGKDVFKKGSLKRAVKKRDYFFIGKWLFWVVIANGFYTAFRINSSFEISSQRSGLPIWILQIFEIISTIAIFGLIPVIFFVVYSLRLSKEQRAEKRLTLLMPMYVLIIYGISLLIFIAFFI